MEQSAERKALVEKHKQDVVSLRRYSDDYGHRSCLMETSCEIPLRTAIDIADNGWSPFGGLGKMRKLENGNFLYNLTVWTD